MSLLCLYSSLSVSEIDSTTGVDKPRHTLVGRVHRSQELGRIEGGLSSFYPLQDLGSILRVLCPYIIILKISFPVFDFDRF